MNELDEFRFLVAFELSKTIFNAAQAYIRLFINSLDYESFFYWPFPISSLPSLSPRLQIGCGLIFDVFRLVFSQYILPCSMQRPCELFQCLSSADLAFVRHRNYANF